MITDELGAEYTNDAFQDRWFRRPSTGEICTLYSIGSSYAVAAKLEFDDDDDEWLWGDTFEVPSSEFVDLSLFQYPELGYRHSSNGTDLWNITRIISTRRGLYEGNTSAFNVTQQTNWADQNSAYKARLIYQPEFKSLAEAVRLLNASPRGCRGWAMSSNFAICRTALGSRSYKIHFAGKLVGTCTEEGVVEIASRSINRMFQKVT